MYDSLQKANLNLVRPLILASGSPRRKELLSQIVSEFEIVPSDAEELKIHEDGPVKLVETNARLKANSVAFQNQGHWVLGADTLVFYNDKILGKPRDIDEAVEMLLFLSGKSHKVATGVCLQCMELEFEKTFSETTRVQFKQIDKSSILDYFSHVDPLDKAGAYAIQSFSELIIEEFEGSYSNVVGLPVESLGRVLSRLI